MLSNVDAVKDNGRKDAHKQKPHPVRLDSYSAKLFYERNDFSYIEEIADPNRNKRAGAKGYLPSSLFKALLLMYLLSLNSLRRILGSTTVFMQGGSFRLVLPKRAARLLGIRGAEDIEPDEFTFILLETDKGIMLRPVREYISDRDMRLE